MNSSFLVVFLAMVCAAGVFYVVAYPALSGDAKRDQRTKALRSPNQKRSDRTADVAKRRAQIVDSLKELDGKSKRKRTFSDRLTQAGLDVTPRQFFIGSGIFGCAIGALVFYLGTDPLIGVAAAFTAGIGAPRWMLSFKSKRRLKKFTAEFPNAVDVIIRGVKAGLPLADCLRIIAAESAEPVRSEFRKIAEAQAVGMSIPEAVDRLQVSVPTSEVNFFSIVISLQSKSGGNLSEALANLSRVLRDRKKLAMKIRAMSSEAKSSAGIIGAMPFLVSTMVWLTAPEYISLMWTQTTGLIVLGCCALWMGTGIFVMRKMINFDF